MSRLAPVVAPISVNLARGSTVYGGMLGKPAVSALVDSLIRSETTDAASEVPPRVGLQTENEDEALVRAIRAGDRGSEELLYRRHAAAVLGLATRLLHSREEAMDVLQDAFVTAFERLNDLREPAAFRPWLMRVTASLVHRRFRRQKLLGFLGLGRKDEPLSLDDLADPSATTEARAELRLLDRKLAAASPQERAAWMLRHIEGFALEEIAEVSSCSLATAKRRIAAADAVVRAHFEEGR